MLRKLAACLEVGSVSLSNKSRYTYGRKQIRHLVDPLNAQFSARAVSFFPSAPISALTQGTNLAKMKTMRQPKTPIKKKAYKFFAVH